MKPQYDLLGKSHYALAVICDLLALLHPEGCQVQIVTNIAEEQNTSRAQAFSVTGIDAVTIPSHEYQPDPAVPKILASIGKARYAIYRHFETQHGIGAEQYQTLVHPAAVIGAEVSLGHGVHVGPGATIAPYASLGDFCVVNRQASVGHHSHLDAYVCLNPGVTLAGVCTLGAHVTVGAGATIIDQIRIGSHSMIGAGSVVTREIPEKVVAYGVPARVVRTID
ncbi:MAG: hypothetical protein R3330_08795 [Saprospiraceae bacterium]|nr:hypothetical protein [Saprospiraceae bacterium]